VYLFFSVILGDIIETLKENGYEYTWGNVTVMLAEAFGFCWGVEKAVQIAYEARKQFPNHKIWITNEIIHNPTVNKVCIHFLFSTMISQLF
jgi:4-hydroxy-3-methylbut-2-enyl diphosphate reductase